VGHLVVRCPIVVLSNYHGWVEEVQEGGVHSQVAVAGWDIASGSYCFDTRHNNTAAAAVVVAADCNGR